jgi:hypothetical protein
MTKSTHQFKRGDRVFVCQVGFSGYGEWGVVRHRDHSGHFPGNWYIVARGNKRETSCVHESWLNRKRPDAALDSPLCFAA